jgi:hypothetical protein
MEKFAIYLPYVSILLVGWLSAFLRSTQNKNVNADLKFAAGLTGLFMGLCDAIVFALIAKSVSDSGLDKALIMGCFSGLGIGLGYVSGMIIHNRLMRNKLKAEKKKKRSRLDKRIAEIVREELEDIKEIDSSN